MKYTKMTSALYAYLVVHGHNHDPVLDALREETTRESKGKDDYYPMDSEF